MPRMIDLVRKSQMSSNLMQAAARGALAVQSGEMLEILVHLALHNKVFGEQARMTLAGWDEKASAGVAADPATSREVLGYLVSPKNLRPALLPALLENPSALMNALESNPRLRPNELAALQKSDEPAEIAETDMATPQVAETAAPEESSEASEIPTFPVVPDDSESVDHSVVEQAIAVY